MRLTILISFVLAASTLLTPTAPATSLETLATAQVTLIVSGEQVFPFDVLHDASATSASCVVTVDTGTNGGDILDQAVDHDCIESWDYDVFGDDGRFVSAIDGLRGHCPAWPLLCSFWRFDINGSPSDTGIDFYSATEGDQIEFHYDRGVFGPVPG